MHHNVQMQSLQAAIKYEQDDLAGTKTMLAQVGESRVSTPLTKVLLLHTFMTSAVMQCITDDAETIVSHGCVAFKVGVCRLIRQVAHALWVAGREVRGGQEQVHRSDADAGVISPWHHMLHAACRTACRRVLLDEF